MGVLGLWQLLAPVGQPVALESLENKIFAVDISIWLNQALKGYRDSQGGSVPNAHLLSLFSRLCKLLFYRIRPIIVFDGGYPELKRQTIINRQKRRASVKQNSRDVGLKILTNYLASQNLAIAGGSSTSSQGIVRHKEKVRDEIYKLPPLPDDSASLPNESIDSNDWKFTNFSKEDIVYLNQIDIDSDDFNNLPPDVKQEILSTLKESRRHRTWEQSAELPEESNQFSNYQMQCLLKKRKLQKKLEQVQRDLRQINTADFVSQYTNDHVIGETNKIMADDCSHYVLLRKIMRKTEVDSEGKSNIVDLNSSTMIDTKNAFIKDMENIDVSNPVESKPVQREITYNLNHNKSQTKVKLEFDNFDTLDEESVDDPENFLNLQNTYTETTLKSKEPVKTDETVLLDEGSHALSDVKHTNTLLDEGSCSSSDVKHFKTNPLDKEPCSSSDRIHAKIIHSQKPTSSQAELLINRPLHSNLHSIADTSAISNKYDSHFITDDKQNDIFKEKGSKNLNRDKEIQNSISNDIVVTSSDDEMVSCDEIDAEFLEDMLTPSKYPVGKLKDTVTNSHATQSIIQENKSHFEVQTNIYISNPENVNSNRNLKEISPIQKHGLSSSEKPSTSNSQSLSKENNDAILKQLQSDLDSAIEILEGNQAKQDRQNRTVQEHMVEECKELLQLFGIPFVVSPTEAEAQCAFYDIMDLTHGTITDDSDVWLFGGKRVYKNFFAQQKYVEFYKDKEIFNHFSLSRKKLINFAMLTGSDYTEGIEHVGPVTAMEILSEFPGEDIEVLKKFKEWWTDTNKHIRSPENKVRAKLLKLVLSWNFPDEKVCEAYLNPTIDDSTEKFSWGRPDLDALREYTKERFGWNKSKVDDALLPVIKKLNERESQTHIDSFFTVNLKKQTELFPSKRIMSALKKMTSPQKNSTKEDTQTKTNKRKCTRAKATSTKKPATSNKKVRKNVKQVEVMLSEESSEES